MPLTRRAIGTFIRELSRRRVFRVAAWYIAVAIAVVGLAADVSSMLGLPEGSEEWVLVPVLVGAPITLVLAWFFDITPGGVHRTDPVATDSTNAPTVQRVAEDPGRSIAVLPFSEMGGGEDYFADGITEDIIAALSHVRDLKVISRTSIMQYRATTKPIPTIASELDVAHVLEGSVRRAGDRVRIVAQLIHARTDEHLWVETYDRDLEDIFAIQSDVAQQIAAALHAELTASERGRLERRPTGEFSAYDHYLRGRHLWNQRTERAIRAGIVHLQEALELDAGFALTWAALAEAYVTLGLYGAAAPVDVMPLALDAAERALGQDAELAEALVPLAAVKLYYDRDRVGAEQLFRRAIDANPRYPVAHHWYANLLASGGRFDEARISLDRARELDPLSPAVLSNAGIISYNERDWARAVRELELVVERHAGFGLAHLFLGLARGAAGDRNAVDALRDAVRLTGGSVEARAALAGQLARRGSADEAHALLRGIRAESGYVSPVQLALVHAGLGEMSEAVEELRRAFDLRATELVWLSVRPELDRVRKTPGFSALSEDRTGHMV